MEHQSDERPKVFFDVVDAFGNVHGVLAMARKSDSSFEILGLTLAGNNFNLRVQENSKAAAGMTEA